MESSGFQPNQPYDGYPYWFDPFQHFEFPVIPEIPHVRMEKDIIGIEPEIQTFYEGPEKVKDKVNWVERKPTALPENAKEKYNKVAICVYKKKDRGEKRKNYGGLVTYKFHSIEIQSSVIIAAIKPILAAHGTSIADDTKFDIESPFKDLYFGHSKIIDAERKASPGSEESLHLKLLVQIMDELFGELLPLVTNLHSKGHISFDLLWTLFPKGILVYTKQNTMDRLYQVVSTDQSYHFNARVDYVQFNGSYFGVTRTSLNFRPFKGIKPISSLVAYPLGFHSDKSLETRLLKRGERVLDFQDIRYRGYNNAAIELTEPTEDPDDEYESDWYDGEEYRTAYFQVDKV